MTPMPEPEVGSMKLFRYLAIVAMAVALGAAELHAAGPSSSTPTVTEANELIKKQDYRGAIAALNEIVTNDARDADAFNLLGFAHRKLGRFAEAKTHYDKALALNPKHKGAHEYIGELYLETGDLASVETHLGKLAELCPSGCEEREDLQKAVAAYKAKRGS
ncbi:MAG: tetratricopeptide repeat protein [Alphaproteobacteria bacterium]|nr:tetratricopeptide repeat protein [Alphaproteobacteria bacterium]